MRIVSTLDIHGTGGDTPALRTALDNLRRFHAAGGTVVYGTDLGNGPIPSGIHTLRAAAPRRDWARSRRAVLAALTRAPLEPGAPADLIVAADSPVGDPGALDDLRVVVRAGRVVVRRDPAQ